MLITCPECSKQISDKASNCPQCGYPMADVKPQKISSKRRMRLPNGFGQITEIKGKRLRKPFRVMVTVGKTEEGRPICKLLKPEAYFRTYNEAYSALTEYNKNPYELADTITINELYDKWFAIYQKKSPSASRQRSISSAWKYCSSVYDLPVRELKIKHIRYCLDEGTAEMKGKVKTAPEHMKIVIKTIFDQMLDYAIEYELIDRNVSRTFKLHTENITADAHNAFTDQEMQILWGNRQMYGINIILIQCYTGLRPQEIGLIRTEDVDIKNWRMTGGIKTKAGKNRTIPIHTKIRPFVQSFYDIAVEKGYEYLIPNRQGKLLTYDTYKATFLRVMKTLRLNEKHRPHDCRKHFITQAKKYKVDEYAIKHIVGHSISDITEKIYTERDPNWLSSEIEKIR